MKPAVVAHGLTKRYGEVVAVNNLELSIERGELISLLGVNGAGKTTAIKMLSCLTSPTEGDAEIMGCSIRKNPNGVKAVTGVSPQETSVAQNLTVFENLAFIAQIYGFSPAQAKQKADEMIEKLSLEEVRGRYAKRLSGGYMRRLSVAMALITEPKVLFLDEPTLGLDVLSRRELWHIVESVKGSITVVLTTHYLEEAEALSDRVAIMSKGRIITVGTVEEIKSQSPLNDFEDAFVRLVSGDLSEKKVAFSKNEEGRI